MNPFDQFDGGGGNAFDQFDAQPKKDPQIGKPQELTFAEKYLAPVLEKMGQVASPATGGLEGAGISRGGWAGRLAKGASDPGVAIAQLAANAVGQGDPANKWIAEKEAEYQAARKAAGSEGFDPLRMTGATGMSLMLPGVGAAGSGAVRGAVTGAAMGALNPVTEGSDYWKQKGKDVAGGAAVGAVLSPLMGALARVVSPKASVNPQLQLLQKEGVEPTVGQSLGGWANATEEKLQSVPVVGDAIRSMRQKAVDQFNQAAINRTVAPIGERVNGTGQGAVAEAGDKLSAAYDAAIGKVNHVNFDTPAFNQQFSQLQQMATGLSEPMVKKFQNAVDQVVLRKMSPNGSILGTDLKAVDSELGTISRRYGSSSVASEQELGDAVKQLQAVLRQEVARSNPAYATAQKAADTGWANLVRVEGASKAAVNNEGVFTPAQLNRAIRTADTSVRDRSTSRGQALMQDLGNAGQSVLANRVPNSGTTDRALLAMAATAPLSLPAAGAGAMLYTKPVQNFLRHLIATRPDQAPAVANYLRRLSTPATVAAVPWLEQGNR